MRDKPQNLLQPSAAPVNEDSTKAGLATKRADASLGIALVQQTHQTHQSQQKHLSGPNLDMMLDSPLPLNAATATASIASPAPATASVTGSFSSPGQGAIAPPDTQSRATNNLQIKHAAASVSTSASASASASVSASASTTPLLARSVVQQLEKKAAARNMPFTDSTSASTALTADSKLRGIASAPKQDVVSMDLDDTSMSSSTAASMADQPMDPATPLRTTSSRSSTSAPQQTPESTAASQIISSAPSNNISTSSIQSIGLHSSSNNSYGSNTLERIPTLPGSPSSRGSRASSANPNAPVPTGIEKLVETGKLIALSPLDLLAHLKATHGECHAVPAKLAPVSSTSTAWTPPSSILLIDTRSCTLYEHTSIAKSICANFPVLLIKRFKRRAVSNFNLSNFITEADGRNLYMDWQQAAIGDRSSSFQSVVVVYDDKMAKDNYESEAWSLVAALADGMSVDLVKYGPDAIQQRATRQIVVAFLEGGMDAFAALDGASEFLNTRSSDEMNRMPGMMTESASATEGLSAMSSNAPSGPRTTASELLDQSDLHGGHIRRLSLNTCGSEGSAGTLKPNKSRAAMRQKSLSGIASREPGSNQGSESSIAIRTTMGDLPLPATEAMDTQDDSPTTSPNDNAAPPEPVSRVNQQILLGSDVIPLAPDAVEQLNRLGVTHILNMAAEVKNSPAVVNSGQFQLKWLPVQDNTEQDMDGPLMEAIQFITNAIATTPNAVVFVHCKAGRSRSVSVVLGYLVTTRSYTLRTAYDLVRRVRKGVSPNLGFMAALMKVEHDIY
eukprot:jgi/Hompol1/15/HPOL_001682-RA